MSTPTPELLDEARRELRELLAAMRAGLEAPEKDFQAVDGSAVPEPLRASFAAFQIHFREWWAVHKHVGYMITVPQGYRVDFVRLTSALTRLCALLGLSGRERAFVSALADDAADFDLYSVLADYLEDQGRTRDGARVRRLVPRDGDVLVWQTGVPGPGPWERPTAYQEAADRVRKGLAARGVDTHAVTLPAGADLSAVDPEQMRLAGWVRDGEAHRLALERAAEELERAACGEDGPYASPDMLRARAWQLRYFAAET
jgi:hypothetical protein